MQLRIINPGLTTKDIAILANQSGRTANQGSSTGMRVNSKKQNAENIQIRPTRIKRAERSPRDI
ncbi:hypothetical protein GXM_10387 [Nostoc sphaeroides CCNUC1]|uniref:Uncharacterized protein n=1 Tax=Nostoc sphaeroides CCNUC1 TaxID=2653204 RepID=A0A5P8WEV3_9NOSO|nr:hypothetical protein GXM_08678 [Nostoc sphaeroides CCNUC1]QFS52632.1 hypothetical protein GXM_10387 [Nostoc sphaeroides CCNUC1]